MWANGSYPNANQGFLNSNSFGVHPFILVQAHKQNQYFGLYFRNSNAQSPILTFKKDGGSTLSYITTGGQIEMYVILRGTVKEVIKQYQKIVGLPRLAPYWSMGFQIASDTYQNQSIVESTVKNYTDSHMPLEAVWLGDAYMKSDFNVDTDKFSNLNDFKAKTLSPKNIKLMVEVKQGLVSDDKNA